MRDRNGVEDISAEDTSYADLTCQINDHHCRFGEAGGVRHEHYSHALLIFGGEQKGSTIDIMSAAVLKKNRQFGDTCKLINNII